MSKQVVDARRFYLDRAAKQRGGITVVSGGWERTARDYRIQRAGFRYFGLEFVAGGRGTLRINQRRHGLERGVVFAYGPRVPHEIATQADDRLSKYFVDFAGAEAERALRRAGVPPGTCQMVAAVDEVEAAFEHLLAAGRRGTPTAAEIAALQGRILLLLLSEVRLPSGAGGNRSRQTFLRCRDYLEQNYSTIRTAEEAAAACRVAPAYFSRLFRRFAGQPAYRFLMRLKMSQAAALLEQQQHNVGETAEALGMDPFHFSRAFKRVHGRPPVSFLRRDSR
ncbi:MAG TPA: AraC family transcriptional regulator [Opitutus sp.]|nr:AraC family transcriptional regulator [Opitutus sp.]